MLITDKNTLSVYYYGREFISIRNVSTLRTTFSVIVFLKQDRSSNRISLHRSRGLDSLILASFFWKLLNAAVALS